MPAPEVLTAHDSVALGLSSAEASRRLTRYGPNVMRVVKPEPAWRILLQQMRSVVVLLLVVAALLAWFLSERADAIAIGAVLVLNVGIGFATELPARRAMEALRRLDAPSATVLRDGRVLAMDARALVPGDVITLEAGQAVPADGRLLAATELRVVEAALTGESATVEKHADAVLSIDTPLPDRETMVFKGTTIAEGSGRAVIVATAMATEVGRIGTMVSGIAEEPTLLERRLDALGARLAFMAVGIGALVALQSLWRGDPLAAVLEMGIAVAIAAVPEGLPAVVTVTMAIATRRMARRSALVRRLPAVETLGSVTVICSDKTGTLTAGEQTVTRVWMPDVSISVSSGQMDESAFRAGHAEVSTELLARLREGLAIAVYANRAEIRRTDDRWVGTGDPSEVAMLVAARKLGLQRSELVTDAPELGEVPFSSARMYMASLHARASAGVQVYMKGAHDRVLAHCGAVRTASGVEPLDASWRSRIDGMAASMAADGLRVFALASGTIAEPHERELTDLVFSALLGLTDPPADGVPETIQLLRGAGIRTIMLTGDHRATAQAIGRAVGLDSTDASVIDGAEIDTSSDATLVARADDMDIVSRVSPEGKLRIVSALQRRGHVVAMLGDGINDAAALKKADIGVAMGRRGTDAAKEVAGIVLADDRFQTIGVAVEEGRVAFDNIRKFVFYLFSCNLGEVLALVGAGVLGLPLPMTPMQILWMNVVTDTFPALALAMEPPDRDVMRRAPRPRETALLSGRMIRLTLVYAVAFAVLTLSALIWGLTAWPQEPARAVTLAFSTLGLAQIFHVGNARSEDHVVSLRRALSNRWALGAILLSLVLQLSAVLVPPLAGALQSVAFDARGWIVAVTFAALPALVGQAYKWVSRRPSRSA